MLPVLSMCRMGPGSVERFALILSSWDFKGMSPSVTQDMQLGAVYQLWRGICSFWVEIWLMQSPRAACLLRHGRCSSSAVLKAHRAGQTSLGWELLGVELFGLGDASGQPWWLWSVYLADLWMSMFIPQWSAAIAPGTGHSCVS